MSQGKILFAEHEETYILKFVGDVRLTICSPLELLTEESIKNSDIKNVVIDLNETTGIDSTALGLLTTIAINFNKARGEKPLIVCNNKEILQLLMNMRFDKVFNITEGDTIASESFLLNEFPVIEDSEIETAQRSLKAHKALMALSAANKVRFEEVVKALEEDLQKHTKV